MTRPKCCRRIGRGPVTSCFQPETVTGEPCEEIVLTLDEFEALRLADYEGLYQEQAAARMNVSRQTFGRIVDSARGKMARMLVQGCTLRIRGGDVEMTSSPGLRCEQCDHYFEEPCDGDGRLACPKCKKMMNTKS